MVKKMKIGAIIQARLNSTRLPHKVLMPLPFPDGKTILEHVIAAAEKSNKFNGIVVATSNSASDDKLADFLTQKHTVFYRGSEDDVLSRFYEVATEHAFDVIVRLTADNPCLDPEIIAATIEQHILQENDYTRTTGLPIGMNLEIMSYKALKAAHEEGKRPSDREHVTGYIFDHPDKFKVQLLPISFANADFADFRLTVDYASDYALLNLIFNQFSGSDFKGAAIYDFWQQHAWVQEINKTNYQKKTYADPQEELSDAVKLLKFHNFETAAAQLTSEIGK